MKQRRPWIHYSLIWLSGGLFWLAWPFLMAKDINSAARHHLPLLSVLSRAYCGIFILYLGLVAYQLHRAANYNMNGLQPFEIASGLYVGLLLGMTLVLFAVPAYLVAKTAGFLHARRRSTLSVTSSVALFLLYGISLPMLQRNLNEEWGNTTHHRD